MNSETNLRSVESTNHASVLSRAIIRRARPEECDSLTRLTMRSKAYWGYDERFMGLVAPELEVTAEYISEWPVYVLELAGSIVAFYGFRMIGESPHLYDLFVAPEWIRKGAGSLLWKHALETARSCGFHIFFIESDPNAEPFYVSRGAKRIGESQSVGTGRKLPLLRFVNKM